MESLLVEPSVHLPQLSVIIACRNAEEVLGVQLAALARQKCPVPWELLVCDNGSRDNTVALAKSWADRLPLRVVLADEVAGAGPARNAGVEQARGEWIGFCDADDEVGDGWLEALCRALATHPFVAGRFDGHRLNSPRTLRSRALDQQDGLQLSSTVVGLPHAGGGNMGIHRSAFLEVGGFDPAVRYLQDTDLCWRVQLAGYPLVFIPDLLIHVRLRSTLRGMYQQGRNYGASLASLERRYAGAAERLNRQIVLPDAVGTPAHSRSEHGPRRASITLEPAGQPTPGVSLGRAADGPTGLTAAWNQRIATGGHLLVSGARLGRFFIANRSSLGAQAWQIGWHVGYRS